MSDKQIHIEKYDFATFEKEQKPYLMILTDLIQKFPMKHSNELLLWMFLESLPTTWKPNKNHIIAHFNISERTYMRYMGYLHATKLIEYRQTRNEAGEFIEWHLIVLNGTQFDPSAPSSRTAKFGGMALSRTKNQKVIHISDVNHYAKFGGVDEGSGGRASIDESPVYPVCQISTQWMRDTHINKTYINTKAKKKTNNATTVDNRAQILTTPAPRAVPTAPNAYLNKQESSQEVYKKKQKQEPVACENHRSAKIDGTANKVSSIAKIDNCKKAKNPVSVFSDTVAVKNHITSVIAKRNVFVEDDIIEEGIYYAFATNPDKSFDAVNKRINIFLKKVREGKWLIPQGYKGITTQAIREKEEQEQQKKQEQYKQDALVMREIQKKVLSQSAISALQSMKQIVSC